MQEMEVYVENIRRKFGVFNYSPFRTPYTPNSQYQMLLDPSNPSAGAAKIDKQEKVKLNFDMTASPKILMSKPMLSGGTGRRISLSDMPRSPMSTNSSVHTGSDVEQDAEKKATSSHFSASEESIDFLDKSTASPASTKTGQAGSLSGSPKPFSPQVSTPITTKTDKTSTTGSILNLNLDRSKAEMDLKELSESVQQQSAPVPLISPKRQIRSRFQLNLDKTIESCKAQLGINEISEDVYTAVEHSDSEDSEKSDSSGSDSVSDEEQRSKNEPEDAEDKEDARMDKEPSAVKKKPKLANPTETKEELKVSTSPASEKADPGLVKEKTSPQPEKDFSDKAKPSPHPTKDKLKGKDETDSPTVHLGLDSDSESELVIDLGEDHSGREGRKNKKEPKEPSPKQEAVQQKEITQSPSTSTITLVTSTQSSPLVTNSGSTSTVASSVSADLPIATASADVAADIAKYTSKIRRLRIEIEKLQWLHQQELSEMKHNLATAPQQEADAEVNTETLNKSSQGASSNTQAAPPETSTSKEKETPAEKSKDGGSFELSSFLARRVFPLHPPKPV
ncbi:hypothetical protein E2I00_010785 [Balaenoptera physalus]|uniref:ZMYND8 coiled-coil domain-containing protein n=1 Tax=Balaenoptera physalus TaxID=9770 RepID=A0A643CIN1_BALPH|nr:hypothetical protein E2I00_010785 [Balaenoptera physalus]